MQKPTPKLTIKIETQINPFYIILLKKDPKTTPKNEARNSMIFDYIFKIAFKKTKIVSSHFEKKYSEGLAFQHQNWTHFARPKMDIQF